MWIDTSQWRIVASPGYAGVAKTRRNAARDKLYGPGNWQSAFLWGDYVVERAFALQLYEDAYLRFLSERDDLLEWLCATACDVYDNAPENVESGLDYDRQEAAATHLQDIAVRRALLRLGKAFRGNRLVEIRGKDSEGYLLNPGLVPFHLPHMIRHRQDLPGWIQPGSVEDFWQSNKVLVVRRHALRPMLTVDVIVRNDAGRILLVDRSTEPLGWALPGGKVEYGETLREAASREVLEETGLRVSIGERIDLRDSPSRDPRHHFVSIIFTAQAEEPSALAAGDGVKRARFFAPNGIPQSLVCDHSEILGRYLANASQVETP